MKHRSWLRGATLVAALACVSSARASEIHIHGLLDAVGAERASAFDLNTSFRGDNPFDAIGVRLFADALVNDRLQVFTQIALKDESGIYLDGAYLMFTPRPSLDLHVQAGKIPSPIGTWAPHTYSNKNPLVSSPLMYQYHSTLLWYEVPGAAPLLAAAGTGQDVVNYYGYDESKGMALVDDSYWDTGVTINGSRRPFEYAAGITTGTPGWGVTSQDDNNGKSVQGRLGLAPFPWLRLGVSGAYGPYLVQEVKSQLPPGKEVTDYHQKMVMTDLSLEGGHFALRSEGITGAWESPLIGDLDFTAGYAELKYALAFGGYVAGRYDALRFGDIPDAAGLQHSWDSNVDRYEVGAGYRFNRDVVVKLVHQHTRVDAGPVYALRRQSLVAAQLSVAF